MCVGDLVVVKGDGIPDVVFIYFQSLYEKPELGITLMGNTTHVVELVYPLSSRWALMVRISDQ